MHVVTVRWWKTGECMAWMEVIRRWFVEDVWTVWTTFTICNWSWTACISAKLFPWKGNEIRRQKTFATQYSPPTRVTRGFPQWWIQLSASSIRFTTKYWMHRSHFAISPSIDGLLPPSPGGISIKYPHSCNMETGWIKDSRRSPDNCKEVKAFCTSARAAISPSVPTEGWLIEVGSGLLFKVPTHCITA